MTPTTEVAPQHSSLPALAHAPGLDIDAGDVSLTRVKVGQFSSKQVQAGLVTAGVIFSSAGEDDAAVLYDPEDKKAKGVLIYVLGMTKGKSVSVDGSLERYAFNDPAAPPEAWVTYDYVLSLPELEDPFPLKWLMTKSAAPAAKAINTVLKKNQGRGPAWANAFRVTTAPRKNTKGNYFVPVVSPVEADPKHVEAAGALTSMIAGSLPDQASSVPPLAADAPAI